MIKWLKQLFSNKQEKKYITFTVEAGGNPPEISVKVSSRATPEDVAKFYSCILFGFCDNSVMDAIDPKYEGRRDRFISTINDIKNEYVSKITQMFTSNQTGTKNKSGESSPLIKPSDAKL